MYSRKATIRQAYGQEAKLKRREHKEKNKVFDLRALRELCGKKYTYHRGHKETRRERIKLIEHLKAFSVLVQE